MYQSPDFVKVSISVKDVYAGYIKTGCPFDEGSVFTVPCVEGSPGYIYFNQLDDNLVHQCYSTDRP